MRRAALIALAALTLLSLPGAAQASGSVQIRRVDLDRFPLVRVTAVVPEGQSSRARRGRPPGRLRHRPSTWLRARGRARRRQLGLDDGPAAARREACGRGIPRTRAGGGPSRPRVLRPRGARVDAAARSDIVGGSEALVPRPRHAEGDGALRRRRPVGRAATSRCRRAHASSSCSPTGTTSARRAPSPKRSPQRAAPM